MFGGVISPGTPMPWPKGCGAPPPSVPGFTGIENTAGSLSLWQSKHGATLVTRYSPRASTAFVESSVLLVVVVDSFDALLLHAIMITATMARKEKIVVVFLILIVLVWVLVIKHD